MNRNIFNSIKLSKPKKNNFNLTHDVKMSGQCGQLLPSLVMECIPGDSVNISCESLVRFAPMLAPVMTRFDVFTHYFFVPNRLVWDNWEDFITNQATGGIPFVTIDAALGVGEQKFLDYFGIPPIASFGGGANPVNVNALPLAAFQMIYNEYYRDENLVAPVLFDLTDGDNSTNADLTTPRRRAWEHDYFTSALPFAQKGTAVDVPLGDVLLKTNWDSSGAIPQFLDTTDTPVTGNLQQSIPGPSIFGTPATTHAAYDPDGTLEVGATTINDLRRAFRLQEWFEKLARGGSRFTEFLLSMFGVRSKDSRLQRPEYITGVKSPVQISEVLQTSETSTTPQGTMAGHAYSVGSGYKGSYYCEEHGYIIAICSVMPKPAYQQGIPKTFLKTDPFEFYFSQFANIGEQPVLNNELYAYQPTGAGTFGYVPRFSEYKYMPNRVAGDFRSTLDFWHAGRIFTALPVLDQTFIEMDEAEIDRIFAVSSDDNLYMIFLHKIMARRPMPVFGTPMI